MSSKSLYDPKRDTVGKIYRDLHLNAKAEDQPEVGDMSREIMKGFVEDLNDAIIAGSKQFEGKDFFITIHEKKDLQMKDTILRRVVFTLFRPYPEDDTVVFHHKNKDAKTYFCWCLPHWSEMDNILANRGLFEQEQVNEIYAWKVNRLERFGFIKTEDGANWFPNPKWEDLIVVSTH